MRLSVFELDEFTSLQTWLIVSYGNLNTKLNSFRYQLWRAQQYLGHFHRYSNNIKKLCRTISVTAGTDNQQSSHATAIWLFLPCFFCSFLFGKARSELEEREYCWVRSGLENSSLRNIQRIKIILIKITPIIRLTKPKYVHRKCMETKRYLDIR